MNFPVTIYLLAILGAAATAVLVFPLWRAWCLRVGLVDDPGHRKIHRETVPLAGGLTVMTALLAPALLAVLALWLLPTGMTSEPGNSRPDAGVLHPVSVLNPDTVRLLAHGLRRRAVELTVFLLGALGMLLVGLLDDKRELRPAAKFGGQLVVSFLVAAAGIRITLFVPSLLFSYAITVLWIVTVINAFNFMDNMNGLCGGLGAIGAFYFALLSALAGQYLVALISCVTFGALLGFLPFNFPRAKAFLGDSGSHLVGYLLAVVAILPHFYTPVRGHQLAVLRPLLILCIPLIDLVWVVLLRWRKGQPFYIGDTNHLSHRLVKLGFTPARAVLLIWFLAATLGGLACLWPR